MRLKRSILLLLMIPCIFCLCSCGKKNDIRGRWDITWYNDNSVTEQWKGVIIQDDVIIAEDDKEGVEKITNDEVIFIDSSIGNWRYTINDDELHITCETETRDRKTSERVTVTMTGIGFRVD